MPEAGSLWIVKGWPTHLFKQKKSLIDEWSATRKQWAQIFKPRTTIEVGEIIFFLEEEHISIADPELKGFNTWKVLYKEEIGWVLWSFTNFIQVQK